MKYVVLMILIAMVVFISCKKTNSSNASVLFYNATWSLPAITAAWNGNEIITTAIAQGQSSGTADSPYAKVPAGTNLITLKAGANTLLDKNIYAAASAGSSFIFFDTSTVAAPVRILQLTDDLSLPDTGQLKYRVLNLVPDTSVKVDIWLVNGASDSMRLDSAGVFAGTAAVASSIQSFNALPFHGGNYTVKIKKTATEQVYIAVANYPFAIKGIYSIIFSGLLTGTGSTGFKLSVLHHPPQ
ncbi:MAG TPA: DUF4397 domain-containing protein [Chitinophagaceae bacterium]|nr:DUF4397 domain-containing protein [Chitinophagaceae bacterium]